MTHMTSLPYSKTIFSEQHMYIATSYKVSVLIHLGLYFLL